MTSVSVPPAFDALRARGPQWASWLDRLPRLAADLLEEWQLHLHGPPRHGQSALVLPVQDDTGRALALKLVAIEGDNAGEIPALKAWGARGAVRLERADPRRGALLLERLGPADLTSIDDRASAEVLAGLYRQLHIPAPPTVPDLAPLVSGWLDRLQTLGRAVPAPPRFVQQALRSGRDLLTDSASASANARVLHGDLHAGNVLAATRAPWLVIDPKGVAGDPCYEPAPVLWNRWEDLVATGEVGHAIRERFWALVDAAELDEHRTRDWVVVRAMISISWWIEDTGPAGQPARSASSDWITRCVTVAKAMQEVGGAW